MWQFNFPSLQPLRLAVCLGGDCLTAVHVRFRSRSCPWSESRHSGAASEAPSSTAQGLYCPGLTPHSCPESCALPSCRHLPCWSFSHCSDHDPHPHQKGRMSPEGRLCLQPCVCGRLRCRKMEDIRAALWTPRDSALPAQDPEALLRRQPANVPTLYFVGHRLSSPKPAFMRRP